jgi:predicted Rdx family selenoprotein
MAYQHKMQRNRFEYKYLLEERHAHDVRTFCRAHLVRDDNAKPENKWAYYTHSVYLDGPGLPLYYQVIQGQKNRFKLRVRYYEDDADTPVFFEIKRRVNDIIMKDRALVKRDRALRIMDGDAPRLSDLVKPGNLDHWSSLKRFCEMRDGIAARPRVYVSYLREAWVHPTNDAVRLTFDRELHGGVFDGSFKVKRDVRVPPLMAGHSCVLELKFTDRFPYWFREMAQAMNLERRANAKYCQTAFWVPRAKIVSQQCAAYGGVSDGAMLAALMGGAD